VPSLSRPSSARSKAYTRSIGLSRATIGDRAHSHNRVRNRAQEAGEERERLLRRQQRLFTERDKLLQAHYAEAIPLDLLKTEQDRISGALSQISERLAATETSYNAIETNLIAALGFLEDNHSTYITARPQLRRLINQALFKRILIDQTGDIRADLTEPFSTLLSQPVRQLAEARVGQVDWSAWETSFNEPDASEEAPGFNQTILVSGTGLEPVTPSLPPGLCPPSTV
jgi:hypothetical protein